MKRNLVSPRENVHLEKEACAALTWSFRWAKLFFIFFFFFPFVNHVKNGMKIIAINSNSIHQKANITKETLANYLIHKFMSPPLSPPRIMFCGAP